MARTPATLMSRIEFDPFGGCWLWAGQIDRYGYSRMEHKGKSRHAHVVAWEDERGAVPQGLQLDHLCRIRCCVNPDHMEPVTSRENTLRGNAPSAMHAKKTHCDRGHPLSGENIRLKGRKRICLACVKIREANRVGRVRAAAKAQERSDA